jgi:hypothetical protein
MNYRLFADKTSITDLTSRVRQREVLRTSHIIPSPNNETPNIYILYLERVSARGGRVRQESQDSDKTNIEIATPFPDGSTSSSRAGSMARNDGYPLDSGRTLYSLEELEGEKAILQAG